MGCVSEGKGGSWRAEATRSSAGNRALDETGGQELGSFERKEEPSVGKKLALLGRAGVSKESRGAVISWKTLPMTPKDDHSLIPETCEYSPLRGKKDVADVLN